LRRRRTALLEVLAVELFAVELFAVALFAAALAGGLFALLASLAGAGLVPVCAGALAGSDDEVVADDED